MQSSLVTDLVSSDMLLDMMVGMLLGMAVSPILMKGVRAIKKEERLTGFCAILLKPAGTSSVKTKDL